jgi:hypothetical protein
LFEAHDAQPAERGSNVGKVFEVIRLIEPGSTQ